MGSSDPSTNRFNARLTKLFFLVLAAFFILTSVQTIAWFTDRISHQMDVTVATFTEDGYTLESTHPDGPFIAGEDVEILLSESNEKRRGLDSTITMSVDWNSPDTEINAAEDMTVTLVDGSSTEKITPEFNDDGSFEVTLPAHSIASGSSDDTRTVKLHIPENLKSTGSISVSFDQIRLQQSHANFFTVLDNAKLNSGDIKHDFGVNVGWAASDKAVNNATNAHKAIMGYLTDDAKGIRFEFAFGYATSGMKDFTNASESKWSYYKDRITSITLPAAEEGTVSAIGDYSFAGFTKVNSLTLPETLTAVGAYAFDRISISELTIPASVTILDELSFGHIDELEKITFNQATGTTVKLPAAGKNTGAFYVDSYVETEIVAKQKAIQYGYTWANDHRRLIPMLNSSTKWQFDGTIRKVNPDKLSIVKIVDYYTPNASETSWDASDPSVPGTVTAHLSIDGSMLTIAGNGYGSILANPDSSDAFRDFYRVTVFSGSERLNTSKTVDMESMFQGCTNLSYLDVSQWDTSSVETMNQLFMGCSILNNLEVSEWDTSNLVNAEAVFSGCKSIYSLDVTNWNMKNTVSTESMFENCSSLSYIDVSQWDVGLISNAKNMFKDCASLQSIDISDWDMSRISSNRAGEGMFENCLSLKSLIIPASLEHISSQFAFNCPNLKTIKFLHGTDDPVDFQTAGSSTGAFYIDSYVDTVVVTENSKIKDYDWEADHRAVMFGPGIYITNPPDKTSYVSGNTFDPDGMEVTYIDSNGTKHIVTDYTVPDGTDLVFKQPSVTISYNDGSKTHTAPVNIAVYLEVEVPSQKDAADLIYNGRDQAPLWNHYDSSSLTIGGQTSGTAAGSYSATFTPTSDYAWSDGTKTTKNVTWKINKATLAVPTQNNTLIYSGVAQSPNWSNYDSGKMTIGGTTSGANAISYTATFTLKDADNYQWSDGSIASKNVTWKIGRAAISNVPSQSGSLTYSGSTQSPSWSNYNTIQLSIGGTTSGTNATNYTATFTPTSNYQWSDGSTAAKSVIWKIGKKSLTVPSQSGSLTYNGSAQSPSWSNYNSGTMTLGGTTSATNATSYTATFTLKDTTNYQWSDSTTAAKSVTWKIGRATISTVPTQSGSLIYNGSSQNPNWSNYNSNQLTLGGTKSGINVGSYVATFTPTSNYQWSDGSTAAKNATWKISKKSLTVPTQSGILTYTGSAQSPSWSNYSSGTMTLGSTTTGINATSYTATFTLKDTANYQWSDGTTAAKSVTWKIGRATISTVPSQSGSLTYSGRTQSPSWSNYNSTQLTIGGTNSSTNAGSYTATFTPTANYQWSDGSTAAKSVTWTIGKATLTVPSQSGSLTYSGSAQSPSWSNYNSTQLTIGGTNSSTNAGSYTATFTPTANYQWSGGSTSAKSVTWTIGKATISTVPSQSGSLTYSGRTQSPSWSNYNSTQLSIGGTTSGINAGSYTATFTPTANYQWSGGSTAAKSVTWTIGKATLAVPSQSGSLTYSGSTQSPSWSNYNSAQLTIGGTTSATNAGTYTATFTPKANYQWSGGSTSAKSVSWSILHVWKKYNANYQDPVTTYYWNKNNRVDTIHFYWSKYNLVETPSKYSCSERVVQSNGSYLLGISGNDPIYYGISIDEKTGKYTYTTKTTVEAFIDDWRFDRIPQEIWFTTEPSATFKYFMNGYSYKSGVMYPYYSEKVTVDSTAIEFTYSQGTYIETVSSTSSSAYPNGGKSGDYWYVKQSNTTTTYSKGSTSYGQVSSTNRSAYPDNNYSGSYWYTYSTSSTAAGYYYQGSYVSDVTSSNTSSYPDNGRHTDGYWYVKVSK